MGVTKSHSDQSIGMGRWNAHQGLEQHEERQWGVSGLGMSRVGCCPKCQTSCESSRRNIPHRLDRASIFFKPPPEN